MFMFQIPRFVKGAMNIIDLLGILPYFVSLVLSLSVNSNEPRCHSYIDTLIPQVIY